DGFETRFVDRDVAVPEALHLGGVDIDAEHVIAHLGQAGAGNQPHIACTEDRYLHHLRDDSLEREPPILTPAKAARRLPGRNGRRARISSRPSACLLTILRLLTVRVTGG